MAPPPQPPAQQGALPRPGQIPPAGGPPLGVAPGQPVRPDSAAPQPGDEVITALPSQKIVNPTAVFSGLDKITGRITTFDVAINETVQFGALQVTPRVCYTRPPNETPNTDAFLEVAEITERLLEQVPARRQPPKNMPPLRRPEVRARMGLSPLPY